MAEERIQVSRYLLWRLMHNKLSLVYLISFGDDPQQALEALAGVGPQGQTVFYGDTFQ
jgi:hypothetical protein